MDLIAKKSFRYRGRALKPGDPFEANRTHGRVLAATGRASQADLGTISAPRPTVTTKRKPDAMDDDRNGHAGGSRRQPPSAELQHARAEYTRITGKRFFSGWSLDEIRKRTSQAREVSANNSQASEGAGE
jgi:hypothetical protein